MQSASGLPGLSLKHLFTLECELDAPLIVGNNGGGSERRIIPLKGGTFSGLINGKVLPLGFDALLMQTDLTARPDAKYCLQTDEGETFLVHSEGVRHPPEGSDVATLHVSEYTFLLRLKLETGSPRLAYLNTAIIVGSAKRQDASIKYDAYMLEQHLEKRSS